MATIKRTHVLIPEDVTRAIDKLAGQRKRSKFITEAVKEKLSRIKLLKALEETAGAIKSENHPEWKTSKDVAKWVTTLRKENEKRLKEKMSGRR